MFVLVRATDNAYHGIKRLKSDPRYIEILSSPVWYQEFKEFVFVYNLYRVYVRVATYHCIHITVLIFLFSCLRIDCFDWSLFVVATFVLLWLIAVLECSLKNYCIAVSLNLTLCVIWHLCIKIMTSIIKLYVNYNFAVYLNLALPDWEITEPCFCQIDTSWVCQELYIITSYD